MRPSWLANSLAGLSSGRDRWSRRRSPRHPIWADAAIDETLPFATDIRPFNGAGRRRGTAGIRFILFLTMQEHAATGVPVLRRRKAGEGAGPANQAVANFPPDVREIPRPAWRRSGETRRKAGLGVVAETARRLQLALQECHKWI